MPDSSPAPASAPSRRESAARWHCVLRWLSLAALVVGLHCAALTGTGPARAAGLDGTTLDGTTLDGPALDGSALDGSALSQAGDSRGPSEREPAQELANDANENDPCAEGSEPEVQFDGAGQSSRTRALLHDESVTAQQARLVRNERAAGRRRSRAPPV